MDPVDISVPPSRTITTTSPLTGTGDLSADRTIAIGPGTNEDVLGTASSAVVWRTLLAALNGAIGSSGANGSVLRTTTAALQWNSVSALLDQFATSTGATLYRGSGGGGGTWQALAAGSNGDVLTLSGGIPSWAASTSSGKPTPTNWTADALSNMSGDVTLTDNDDVLLFYDCNGADRNVTLPVVSSSNPLFVIVNATKAASRSILVKTSTGVVIATILPTQGLRCYSDGTSAWIVETFSHTLAVATAGYQVLSYGGVTAGITTRRLKPFAIASESTAITADDYRTELRMTVTGTIDHLMFVATNNAVQTWDLNVNGSLSESVPVTGLTAMGPTFYFSHDMSDAVSAGDDVSLVLSAHTSDLGNMKVYAFVRTTTAARGPSFHWGGEPNTTGVFFRPNREAIAAGTADSTATHVVEHYVTQACVDKSIAWNTSAADGTTDIAIFTNGSSSESINNIAASGQQATSGDSYAVGDQVAIQYVSGTNPLDSEFLLEVSAPIPALAVVFGGDPGGSNNVFLKCFYDSSLATSATTATADHGFVAPYRMETYRYAFNAASSTNAAWKLRRNGAQDQAITPAAAEVTGELTRTTYYPGDYVEVTADSSSGPIMRVTIYFRVVRE